MPPSDSPCEAEPPRTAVEAREVAAAADLVYVDDGDEGIRRVRRGGGFAYRAPDGHWLTERSSADRATLARIRSLAIPPAYEDVWICPLPDGHLQATGRDARGRKQYRYHARWRQVRDSDKFGRMAAFGEALPGLRARVDEDLAPDGSGAPGRTAVLAALVRLLDRTRLRVGNDAYARDNRSYGLSTLRQRHVEVEGHRVRLHFRGKSGVWHDVALQDRRVARVLRRCQSLPGQALFQYTDADGARHAIGSAEVNAYIRAVSGGDFTAKDFRTWHGSVLAWALLVPRSPEAEDAPLMPALREVAKALGNTVAVCRKAYVHPEVLRCAECRQWPAWAPPAPVQGLSEDEQGLLAFLRAQVAAPA